MPSELVQTAQQVQSQQQTLTRQQVLLVRLTELPVNGLRDRINKELEDNQWLEVKDGGASKKAEQPQEKKKSDDNRETLPEDRYDDSDETMPRAWKYKAEGPQQEAGDYAESFFDHLTRQLGEYHLTEREQEISLYIIGCLEDDGMLRTPLSQLADELDIYHDVQTDEEEIQRLLRDVVQQMDPVGVGARNLQECLLLQANQVSTASVRRMLVDILTDHWDNFSHNRWDRIQHALHLSDDEMEEVRRRVRRFTPRPGGSVGNERLADTRTVTPDFLVHIDEEGRLRFSLNETDLPAITVSPDAEVSLKMPVVTKEDREAVRYLRDQVADARLFISALEQRRRTMILTMKAILRLQKRFFLSGDEHDLKPMKLEDVSAITGLDVSTTSRVCNSKYVQTDHGVFSLRWFFSQAVAKDGGEVSVRGILRDLKELIDKEDKAHPLSDEHIVALLREKGYSLARRTVAKYRAQLGIPESRLRI